MLASELIEMLGKIVEEYGDRDVVVYPYSGQTHVYGVERIRAIYVDENGKFGEGMPEDVLDQVFVIEEE